MRADSSDRDERERSTGFTEIEKGILGWKCSWLFPLDTSLPLNRRLGVLSPEAIELFRSSLELMSKNDRSYDL